MPEARRIVGVDESGKGDFFGPLVIAAFLAPEDSVPALVAAGVRDGKTLPDKRILQLDQFLRSDFPHRLVVWMPTEYNRRYAAIRNLNKLLAEGHAEVIETLAKAHNCDLAISDQFGKAELLEQALFRRRCRIELQQMVRGEVVPQVAAASILARAEFIRSMRALSEKFSIELPKGAAAQVDKAGSHVVQQLGPAALDQVCKTHFKNYQRALNPTLFSQ
jgi:ribonuclease HIII